MLGESLYFPLLVEDPGKRGDVISALRPVAFSQVSFEIPPPSPPNFPPLQTHSAESH